MSTNRKTNRIMVATSDIGPTGVYNQRGMGGRPESLPEGLADEFRLAGGNSKQKQRILYASENNAHCDYLVRNLVDYEVRSTASAADAIYLALTGGYDLILVDDRLPGLTGIEVCRQIRAYDHRMPILVISGPDEESKRHRALYAGAQGYWPAPVNVEKLYREVSRLLDLKQRYSVAFV